MTGLATRRAIAGALVFAGSLLAMAASCGGRADTATRSAGPPSELRKAIQATEDASAFRTRVSDTERGAPIVVIDYVAPDRVKTVTGEGAEVEIVVGTSYFVSAGSAGRFERMNVPAEMAREMAMAPLSILADAQDVEAVEDGVFEFSMDEGTTGRVVIEGGYLRELVFIGAGLTQRYEFDRYGDQSLRVSPPEASLVDPDATVAPGCDEQADGFVDCVDVGVP